MLTTELRSYQEEAVDAIVEQGFGLIAYEQGVGKTMAAIAIAEELLAIPEINFALIVVPATLKDDWRSAIAAHTDVDTVKKKVKDARGRVQLVDVPTDRWCVVIDGPPDRRQRKYQQIKNADEWPNYVIVSYKTLVNDYDYFVDLAPDCIIADELTAVKGFSAQVSKVVKEFASGVNVTVGLTGTPVENRIEELFSIMEFIEPRILGDFKTFEAKYISREPNGKIIKHKNIDILNQKLQGVMFRKRRTDPDVAPYMPDVDHRVEYVFLPPKTQALYDRVAREALDDLRSMHVSTKFDLASYYMGGGGSGNLAEQGRLMAKIGVLQMLCDDPRLVRISAEKWKSGNDQGGSQYAAGLLDAGELDDLEPSAKLKDLKERISNFLDQNPVNKVIVFSFYKDMGPFTAEVLSDYDNVLFNGDMTDQQKTAAKERFKTSPDCRVFIASDAGAYGLDLPQANYLINIDQVYSAGKMDQRGSRHVRASSEFDKVVVVDLLADGTIDEQKHEMLIYKRRIAAGAVDNEGLGEGGTINNDLESLSLHLESNLLLTDP